MTWRANPVDSSTRWIRIASRGPGKKNDGAPVVEGLDNGTAHTFELRAQNGIVDGWSDLREIHVGPAGRGDIVVTLPGGRACSTDGAIWTAGSLVLANNETATIRGPTGIAVADAETEQRAELSNPGIVVELRGPEALAEGWEGDSPVRSKLTMVVIRVAIIDGHIDAVKRRLYPAGDRRTKSSPSRDMSAPKGRLCRAGARFRARCICEGGTFTDRILTIHGTDRQAIAAHVTPKGLLDSKTASGPRVRAAADAWTDARRSAGADRRA